MERAAVKRKMLRFGKGFRVIPGDTHSQAAEMVLPPGDAEGGPDNRHRGSDQWLYVVSGTGQATIEGRRHPLRAGTLLCIQRGERHEVRNTGRGLLKTVNVYVPPAYDRAGEPLQRGRK